MLAPAAVEAVADLLARGHQQIKVARMLGISEPTVAHIAHGRHRHQRPPRPEPPKKKRRAHRSTQTARQPYPDPFQQAPVAVLPRCPECGAKVQMPCLACWLRAHPDATDGPISPGGAEPGKTPPPT